MSVASSPTRIPAPVRPPMINARVHWSKTFADAVAHHVWRQEALDAFESHAFTGAPGTERWCTRCTLVLRPGWKDPTKPVPLHCGDPAIRFVPAWHDPTPLGSEMPHG